MKLSIIIPVFNEEKTIEEIIKRVEAVSLPIKKEIIVVDDGSFDNTKKVLKKLKKEFTPHLFFAKKEEGFNFTLIEHQKNQGKGAAIKTGLSQVTGDFVLIQDADLEYNPKEYSILLAPLLKGEAEVVYGSRISGGNRRGSWSFFWGGKILTFLANLLYGLNITDEATCYKVFKSEILKDLDLKGKRFEFCPEVTAKVAKKGIEIYEVPISYNPRKRKEGKKIKWKDGIKAILILIKFKFK